MATKENEQFVLLDLNAPTFQANLFELHKDERNRVLNTLEKISRLTWQQVYADQGLNWEEIKSRTPPAGIAQWYSLRITLARRAVAYRDGRYLRLLTLPTDHDATYGKK